MKIPSKITEFTVFWPETGTGRKLGNTLYSFKISFLGVVHFRGSPFGESMDWGSVFCPSPNFYNSVTSKPEDCLE